MNPYQATSVDPSPTLIESDNFPIDFLSLLAERESWRKEIYRPIYHMHKWWAKRLGTIFRGLLLGCLLPSDVAFEEEFYRSHNFTQVTVFDPFMGSGTTVGEAHKLGCTVLGRDINPIACESVRVALGPLEEQQIQHAYFQLTEGIGKRIRGLYRTKDADGQGCDVLYFFWVKTIECPMCSSAVELFSTRILARNAYPQQKPEVQVCCPQCSAIFPALYTQDRVACPVCQLAFNPHQSTVQGAKATCTTCRHTFSIAKTVQASMQPPAHRLYAKLVLTANGEKQYLPITLEDENAYAGCTQLLADELKAQRIQLPQAELTQGHNPRQALNYNYKSWRDFFNERHPKEVQDASEERFTQKLTQVFAECNRILKQTGLLIFTYHHSRTAGWIALGKAVVDAGFSIVNTHPIKAELSLATPKAQAAEPIQLDIVFVCKKQTVDARAQQEPATAFRQAYDRARTKLGRLTTCGLKLSDNDRKIALLGQFLAQLGPIASSAVVQTYLTAIEDQIDQAVRSLEPQLELQDRAATTAANVNDALPAEQLAFSFD